MPVKVYKLDLSPPARAVLMACDIFNVPAEMIDVNLLEKDHYTPEFLKKNPVHSVPVLEDGDLIIHDSHAILMYLADTYGKDETFYPKDVKNRTLVNQKLFFDTAILFPRLRSVTYAAIIEGNKKVSKKQLNDIDEAYGFLEAFLSQNKFLATDNITVADISAYSTVTGLVHIFALNTIKYPKVLAWMKEMEKQTYVQKYNVPGANTLGEVIKNILEY